MSQNIDCVPEVPPSIGEVAPTDQCTSTEVDAGLTSLMSECASSEPEKVNDENNF